MVESAGENSCGVPNVGVGSTWVGREEGRAG